MSLELVAPTLRPLRPLLDDPSISEIMVNGNGSIAIERDGRLLQVRELDLTAFDLRFACTTIARVLGQDVSAEQPLLDARLPDGSRVAIAFPPVSLDGVTLTIRKFRPVHRTLDELARSGMMPPSVAEQLRSLVRERRTILISGGTGSGKTTLLNALAGCILSDERIGVIEDTAELRLAQQNVFRFEAKPAQPGAPAVTIRDLVKASLRHRPDRLLIGEVRGAEAWDLLQAINTGHAGSLSTIHANSAHQALSRLATLALQADIDIPFRAIQAQIGELVDIVVQVHRGHTNRQVTEVLHVADFDAEWQQFQTEGVYRVPDEQP
jgi:pilus assembly protein CpaF